MKNNLGAKNNFLNDDFLLTTDVAKKLYHDYAKSMPIYDYHCHLSPQHIAQDKVFEDLAEIWLSGDHYKWRLMRECGIDEKYISGNASSYEKFEKYAQIIPYCIGNPVYVWTHLELKRYFEIDTVLSQSTAKQIWDEANSKLKSLSVKKLLKLNNVKTIYTTDDPIDSLEWHEKIAKDDSIDITVSPSFRPDKVLNIHLPTFVPYLKQLEKSVGKGIDNLDDLLQALSQRLEFFVLHGCRCSDHALDTVPVVQCSHQAASEAFLQALTGSVSAKQADDFRSYVLIYLGKLYKKHSIVQQYHIGALRNVSQFSLKSLGPDTGYDAINDSVFVPQLAKLLDEQALKSELPKTILYSLNPRDNEVLAALRNCFSQAGTVGHVQFGSAWWFNDQRDGMTRQLEQVAQFGMLANFVGMLTDSRSFLSFSRHEYFRRILCQRLGDTIESGEYPLQNLELVGSIVQNICYNNVSKYFKA